MRAIYSFTALQDFVESTHDELVIFTYATMVDQLGIPVQAHLQCEASDDVAEFASFHQEPAPTRFGVWLTPFGPNPGALW